MDEQIIADLVTRLAPNVPDAIQRIRRHLDDERLRDMWIEYEEGVQCLRRLSKERAERIREYTALIEDLEREILQYLLEHG